MVYKDKEKTQFPDVALIYQDEEGNYKFVNVIGYIYIYKLNLPTQFFGLGADSLQKYSIDKPICKIEADKLKKIQEELGIDIEDKWSDFMGILRDEIKNKSSFKSNLKQIYTNEDVNIDVDNLSDFDILVEKMNFISEHIQCRMKNAGPNEIQQFYMWLFWRFVFNRQEQKVVNMDNYYRRVGDEVEVISVIKITDGDSKTMHYIYLPKEATYKKTDRTRRFL